MASTALALTAFGECFSQETPRSNVRDAEAAVVALYKQIVVRKPVGIPQKTTYRTIWRLLSRHLTERMNTALACAGDWNRQYPDLNVKPEFDWLEFGLFSGGNEEALPSRFRVLRTVEQKDGSYQVHVKLTYKETFETYGRPPDPKNTFDWDIVAFVIWDGNKFVINDVLYAKDHPNEADLRLSQLLSHGCKGGKWVGDSR